jgi:hypothetical protein
MKLSLPNSVGSQQDVTALQREVKEYARWFAHEAIKKRISVKHTSIPPATTPGAAQLIHEWSAKETLTSHRLDELIKELERYGDKAPTITITLPAPPTNDIKATLVGWCRKNIASDILVTFQFNATILGGMVVRFGSHVYDWSFRRQLLAARDAFPEVLRRV